MQKLNKIIGAKQSKKLVILATIIAFAMPIAASALVSYPPGALLQPGDVTGTIIRSNTITNTNISTTAAIDATKIRTGLPTGSVLFSGGNVTGTSTNLTYATSTNKLYVFGGSVEASTTNFNGVPYTWPSANGVVNSVATNNGSGAISWASPSSNLLSKAFVAGEAITAGAAVSLSKGTATTKSNLDGGSGGPTVTGTTWEAMSTTTLSGSVATISSFSFIYENNCGGAQTYTFEGRLETESAGLPSGVVLASGTTTQVLSNCGVGTFTVTFNTPATVSPSTKYWFELNQTTAIVGVGLHLTTDTGALNGASSANSGSTWGAAGQKWYMSYVYNDVADGQLYNASSLTTNYRLNGFVGLSENTVTAGQTATVDMLGFSSAITTLTRNTSYYLSDTNGLLGTTAGTNSLKVGTSYGTSGFMLRPLNP